MYVVIAIQSNLTYCVSIIFNKQVTMYFRNETDQILHQLECLQLVVTRNLIQGQASAIRSSNDQTELIVKQSITGFFMSKGICLGIESRSDCLFNGSKQTQNFWRWFIGGLLWYLSNVYTKSAFANLMSILFRLWYITIFRLHTLLSLPTYSNLV